MSNDNTVACPDVVWHYTTWKGLEGILDSGAIWASHIEYLNDQQEFNVATEAAVKVLRSSFPTGLESPRSDALDSACTWLTRTQKRSQCVASFSTEGDDLSQWRAYAKGRTGVAIGFKTKQLIEICKREEGRFVKCVYDDEQHKELLEPALRDLVDAIKAPIESREKYCKDTEKIRFRAMVQLFLLATQIKHRAFIGENEWRLVISPANRRWGFHEAHSLAVPHVAVDLKIGTPPALPIYRVRVGPCPHPEAMCKAVVFLARSYGYEIACEQTAVPYRDW